SLFGAGAVELVYDALSGADERGGLLAQEPVVHLGDVFVYFLDGIRQSGAELAQLGDEDWYGHIADSPDQQEEARVDGQDAHAAVERPAAQPVDERLYGRGE